MSGFRIIKTGTQTIQIEERSSIRIATKRYRPLGSDIVLGGGEDGTEQDLRISSRMFMTAKQKEAEEASILYATDAGVEVTEVIADPSFDQEVTPEARTAPYEAFHIKGLGIDFTPRWDDDPQKRDYIYLELDLHANLDIRSAAIVYGPVNGNGVGFIPGEESERTDFAQGDEKLLGWPTFPSSYLFNFELDDEEKFIFMPTGEEPTAEELNIENVQRKAYVLLGYLSKDIFTDPGSLIMYDASETAIPYMYIVGCIGSHLEVTHGLSNELPVLNISKQFRPGQLSSNYFNKTESGGEGGGE
tara:strand:- start:12187 stop:13092 length:906 start_codon:yes stop_codon:yes gene_type:complete